MPQFDFFFFWNCVLKLFLILSILTVFVYNFLLPLIYKTGYINNLSLPAKSDYTENYLKIFSLNENSKNLFRINKFSKIYVK